MWHKKSATGLKMFDQLSPLVKIFICKLSVVV